MYVYVRVPHLSQVVVVEGHLTLWVNVFKVPAEALTTQVLA